MKNAQQTTRVLGISEWRGATSTKNKTHYSFSLKQPMIVNTTQNLFTVKRMLLKMRDG